MLTCHTYPHYIDNIANWFAIWVISGNVRNIKVTFQSIYCPLLLINLRLCSMLYIYICLSISLYHPSPSLTSSLILVLFWSNVFLTRPVVADHQFFADTCKYNNRISTTCNFNFFQYTFNSWKVSFHVAFISS